MVIYNPKDWFSLIFRFHKSDTFRRLIWVMLAVAIYTALIAYIELEVLHLVESSMAVTYSLLSFVISMLLVFRTNTAYDRWWEGRKHWGNLVNVSRNLRFKLDVFLESSPEENKELRQWAILFPYTLKRHLRGIKHPDLPQEIHQPNYIIKQLYHRVQQLHKAGKISGEQLIVLDSELREYSNILGACERIRKTPIPFSYSMFIKKFIFAYVMSMPFGFVVDVGYAMIPIVVFVLYVLASLELIAEEIEDPFGSDTNDLPLEDICLTIEKDLKD